MNKYNVQSCLADKVLWEKYRKVSTGRTVWILVEDGVSLDPWWWRLIRKSLGGEGCPVRTLVVDHKLWEPWWKMVPRGKIGCRECSVGTLVKEFGIKVSICLQHGSNFTSKIHTWHICNKSCEKISICIALETKFSTKIFKCFKIESNFMKEIFKCLLLRLNFLTINSKCLQL